MRHCFRSNLIEVICVCIIGNMLMHSKYEFVVYTRRELDEEYISQLDNQKTFAKKKKKANANFF